MSSYGQCVRPFSSSSSGGKMPAWMHTDGKSPAEMFRNLDSNGQKIVVLSHLLLHEQSDHFDDSISAMLIAVEEKLIQATADSVKINVDKITAEEWLKISRQVVLLTGSVCTLMLYMVIGARCLEVIEQMSEAIEQMSEFGERCLEALGQMRKHSSEIVQHLSKAMWDAKFKPWNKFEVHILDHWWKDPIKQAERDRKQAERDRKKAEKEKEDGVSK